MNLPGYLRFVAIACLGWAWAATAATAATAAPGVVPNVVLILVDDQAWSGTPVEMIPGEPRSATPGIRMPNLQRMAREGMVFSQAYAGHPKCECSRASLLMGRSTTSLNAVQKDSFPWKAPLSESLANRLRAARPDFRTAHFGKWQWPVSPRSLGFEMSDGITQNSDGTSDDPMDPKRTFGITRRALAFLEEQARARRPFFLQLSYYAVHEPPQALAATLERIPSSPGGAGRSGRKDPRLMAAMSEDLDTAIGSVFATLERLGLSTNTLVVYTSDNGGKSALLKGGKTLVDEGGIRVPLIVRGPGIGAGGHCQEPVVGYDLLPTVMDFAAPGSVLPAGVEGGSWKPVLLAGGAGRVARPVDWLVFHHDVEVEHPQTALRQGNLKIVHHWDTGRSFLYDLSVDPGERTDLSANRVEETRRLQGILEAHVRAGLGDERVARLRQGSIPSKGHRKGRNGPPASDGGLRRAKGDGDGSAAGPRDDAP
jgi:arylsulfatase A